MLYDQKPLCDVRICVRITEEMDVAVKNWPGKNLSDKFKNLFNYCFHEQDKLSNEIEQLQNTKTELENEVVQARKEYEDIVLKTQKMIEAQRKIESINNLLDELQDIYINI